MKISASIVTYNNEAEIRGVLDSLMNTVVNCELETIVVDNCSSDNTVKIIEGEYPSVRLIHSPKNGGYGFGHNQAIRGADSDYHFVINPDILFDSNVIEGVVEYLVNHDKVVLAIPGIYDEDGTLKFPPKRAPRLRYLFSRFMPYQGVFKKYCDLYSECEKTENSKGIPFEIEVCSGSFMAMQTSKVKEIDGFDERFFMYFEDFDLSKRMRDLGNIYCLPQFKVIHEGKRAAHHSKNARKMMMKSMRQYFNKWGWKI